jgi:uncharacterized damage-inducible protein DinB
MSTAAAMSASPAPWRTKPALVDALQAQLHSLARLVESLGEHTYRAAPRASSGSAGEHVRHCLDHARALIGGMAARQMSYDSRLRGTAVETDPRAAGEEIDRLCAALDRLNTDDMRTSLILETQTHHGAPPTRVETTIGRELAFVAQHTIHHCATLAVLLEGMGIAVPERFGYAPSTPDSPRTATTFG